MLWLYLFTLHNSNEQLVNSKNRLKFTLIKNIQKEFLTLQLKDFLKKLKRQIQKLKTFLFEKVK